MLKLIIVKTIQPSLFAVFGKHVNSLGSLVAVTLSLRVMSHLACSPANGQHSVRYHICTQPTEGTGTGVTVTKQLRKPVFRFYPGE